MDNACDVVCIYGCTELVINDVVEDIPSTVASTSDDCDRDYRDVIAKGAASVRAPKDMPLGFRAAFVQGPGKLTFEIDQPLRKPSLGSAYVLPPQGLNATP